MGHRKRWGRSLRFRICAVGFWAYRVSGVAPLDLRATSPEEKCGFAGVGLRMYNLGFAQWEDGVEFRASQLNETYANVHEICCE